MVTARNGGSIWEVSSLQVLQHLVRGIEKKHSVLPAFSGDISDLEYFYKIFKKTTEDGDIEPHENMERLKNALRKMRTISFAATWKSQVASTN